MLVPHAECLRLADHLVAEPNPGTARASSGFTYPDAMLPPLSRRRLKDLARLGQRKHRERLAQFIVEGVRSAEAAVEARAPLVMLVATMSATESDRVAALLRAADAPAYVCDDDDFERLSSVATSQGVLAVAALRTVSYEALRGARRILALDGVQDPGNVGTLIRTAAWFGVDALLTGPGTADVFAPKVVRSAMGGLWDLALARTSDFAGGADALADTLARLRADGFACYGADLSGTPARAWQPAAPSVLTLGSEAHGLAPPTLAALDDTVTLPGSPRHAGAESLNVAVAGGILMERWAGA